MQFSFRSGSIKSRVTALLILLVFVSTGLVVLASLYIAERQMRVVAGDQQQVMLKSVAAYIDQDLDAKRTLLAALVEQIDEATLRDPRRLQAFIERRPSLRNAFFNVTAFDGSGALIASMVGQRAWASSTSPSATIFAPRSQPVAASCRNRSGASCRARRWFC
jgi:hypothetical protein